MRIQTGGMGEHTSRAHGPPESGNPPTPKPYTATGGESLERKPFRQGCGEESHPRVSHEKATDARESHRPLARHARIPFSPVA